MELVFVLLIALICVGICVFISTSNICLPSVFPRDEVTLNSDATCNASSEYSSSYVCLYALDDNTHNWATRHEGTGAWIWIFLNQTYYISKIDLRGRCGQTISPKIVHFRFSDASIQAVGKYYCITQTMYINSCQT